MEFNIFMRLKGKVTLIDLNLTEQEAFDQVKTLNLLSDEGEVYYALPTKIADSIFRTK